MGVRSKSRAKPFRKHEFPQVVRHFEGRATYYDWVFQHPNPSGAGAIPVGVVPGQSGTAPNPAAGAPPPPPPPSQVPPVPTAGGGLNP